MSIEKINIISRKPKEEYLECERPCTNCKTSCWINVAGDYKVWSVIQHYCKATKEDSELVNNIFNNKNGATKEDLIKAFSITNKEDIKIILESWGC
ncbi:hypothetical protein FDE77_16470 [Clostridium botulinum]|nr:hypothetical protein [Clostridium botulinum]